MTFWMTLRLAWRALQRNKIRTLLTMLGIIIGVAAVIAMLSIGNGARIAVQTRIASMGENSVHIYGGSRSKAGVRGGRNTGIRMKLDDWRIVASLPTVAEACPVINGSAQLVYGSANWGTSYMGTSPNFVIIRSWPVDQGRCFTDAEVRASACVCMVGKIVAEKLFGAADPLEKTIRVGNLPFKIVGIMQEKGETGWGQSRDDIFIVPYTTAMRKLRGITTIDSLSATARRADQVEALEDQIIDLLRVRYNCRPEDKDAFYAYNQAEISKAAEESTRVFSTLLGGIASVSLLVGGIGIMNIMLVSVTERIREIGIRMAIGARGVDILMQFLVEAVVLSLIGGAIGIALGAGVSAIVAQVAKWPTVISEGSVIVSFGFAALVGVFFGFYPALQASRLDPIEALRHE